MIVVLTAILPLLIAFAHALKHGPSLTILAISGAAALAIAIAGAILVAIRIGLSIMELAHRAETAVFGNTIPEGSRFAGDIVELQPLTSKIGVIALEVRNRRDSETRMAAELAIRERRYKAMAEAGTLIFWRADKYGHLLEATGWPELTGEPAPLTIEHNEFTYVHPDDRDGLTRTWLRKTGDRLHTDSEFRIRVKNGKWLWVRSRGTLIDINGAKEWVGLVEDIEERKQAVFRIQEMALKDPLTGIGNRAKLNEVLGETISSGTVAAVMIIDLDNFKNVNDLLGHLAGDLAIREAVRRIETVCTGAELVSRIGGDEFAVIYKGPDSLATATRLASQLVAEMSQPMMIGEHEAKIGASIGVAPIEGSAQTSLQNADVALYRVKQQGRGGHIVFDDELRTETEYKERYRAELVQALTRGEIIAHFQPKVDMANGALTGFEALARWKREGEEAILPADLISQAENTGLIVSLGEAILHSAVEQATFWDDGLHVAVNVSPIQLASPDFPTTVQKALDRVGLSPRRLELEITENALLENIEAAMAGLLRLKAIGCRIVMDDFFSGNSSLKHLRAFPFDKVKIDRSFIADMTTDSSCEAIVRSMLGLCRDLGISTTAEGIETEEQFMLLADAGCTEGQGYHFGRAISPEAALQLQDRPGRGVRKASVSVACSA